MMIPTQDNTKTVTDLRENTLSVLTALKNGSPQFVIYRSRPRAVMLSINEYQRILETLEDYQDALNASLIIEESKGKKEKFYTFEEVAKEIGYKPYKKK